MVQIVLELQNGVILRDCFDRALKVGKFVLQLVSSDRLVDQGCVWCEVRVQIHCYLIERSLYLINEIQLRVMDVEKPEQLMHDLG